MRVVARTAPDSGKYGRVGNGRDLGRQTGPTESELPLKHVAPSDYRAQCGSLETTRACPPEDPQKNAASPWINETAFKMCNEPFYATLAERTTTATGRVWLFLAYHRNFSECASREAIRDNGTLNHRTGTNAASSPPG
eukprot:gene2605-3680_t